MHKRSRAILAIALVTSVALAACGGDDDASGDTSGGGSTELSLVGFAVPKADHDAAQAAFAHTGEGEGVSWTTSCHEPATVTLTRTEFNHLRLVEGDTAWVRQVEGAPTVDLQAV